MVLTPIANRPDSPFWSLPYPVEARPWSRREQCLFFQVCALPAPLVRAIHETDISNRERSFYRSLAQWCLDLSGYCPGQSSIEQFLLALAETILIRGTTPFCTWNLEQELVGICNLTEILLGDMSVDEMRESILGAVRRVVLVPSCYYRPLIPRGT